MDKGSLNRRDFLRMSAIAGAGVVLAACAPAAVEPTAVPPTEAPAEVEPTAEPPAETMEGREYTIWGLQYDVHIATYEKCAALFEEQTGAVATVEAMDWPIDAKVITAMAAGTVPDVVCQMGVTVQPVVDQGGFVAMDDDVFGALGVDPNKLFNPGAVGAYSYDGKYWGIPTEDTNGMFQITARMDWIEEAGDAALDLWPPTHDKDGFDSYDQMWDLAKILQDSRDDPQVTGLSSAGHDDNTWWSIMLDLGRFWWNEETGEFYLDTPEAIEALQYLIGIPVFEREIEVPQDHMSNAILEQRVAMARWNAIPQAEEVGIPLEGVLAPSAVPGQMLRNVGEGGWGYCVPAQAKNMDIAIEYEKFMCTLEPQLVWSTMYGGLNSPALQAVLDTDIWDGDDALHRAWKRWKQALPNGVYQGNGFGNNTTVGIDIISATEALIRQGDVSIEDGAKQMQEKVVAHYKEMQEAKEA